MTGAMYSSGNGTWEYERALSIVPTAPPKYSSRPIAAIMPMNGTKSPAAPIALAAPSQFHQDSDTPNSVSASTTQPTRKKIAATE